jgi:MFS family permease
MSQHPKWILPIIVFSQFCCTSLWFAGNAVVDELIIHFHLPLSAMGHITSVVQFGFITGTLVFAFLTIADRFSPSLVFLASAFAGGLFNIGVIFEGNSFISLLVLRFFTGFFLAGIYPVGMKIAADYFKAGLGKSLGYLVGALVVGTAFPHLLKGFTIDLPWRSVFIITTSLAVIGGLFIYLFVPNGPFRKPSQKVDFTSFMKVFRVAKFRAAAFGYFGHMWELYAFWAFVPVMLIAFSKMHPDAQLNVPVLSFLIIALGGLACVIGGYLAQSFGAKKIAFTALFLSCMCCLISPLMYLLNTPFLFVSFLLFWGLVVIADSPLFSTLVAQNAIPEERGTALTIVNCIGFAITIISIQLLILLQLLIPVQFLFIVLAVGPILGLLALRDTSSRHEKG